MKPFPRLSALAITSSLLMLLQSWIDLGMRVLEVPVRMQGVVAIALGEGQFGPVIPPRVREWAGCSRAR